MDDVVRIGLGWICCIKALVSTIMRKRIVWHAREAALAGFSCNDLERTCIYVCVVVII
jgi:hypothetical protein